ncbi:MAG: hypothetical protein LYZ69_09540 [Nitrososphaerales archaeon]|nr:hypothetical protein [Nitrososphaerales archaeon]
MPPVEDIESVKANLISFCKNAERLSVLEAVRKPKHYKEVSNITKLNPTTCSEFLKAMSHLNLVEEVGKRKGIYRQSPQVRTLNLRSVIKTTISEKSRGQFSTTPRNVTVRFSDELKIENPGLPESVIREALEMQKLYPYLYLFENSVRHFIMSNMEAKHGSEWWTTTVAKPIQSKAQDRMQKEGRNRWHGKRGAHPIFYVDIDDLNKIITANYSSFKAKMPDLRRPLEWVSQRIEEIEISRNVVAHNNPLSEDDIRRLKVFYNDWVKQMR